MADGLVMMGVSAFWQTVIKGIVIIAAVVIDQAQQRVQSRVALQAQAALGKYSGAGGGQGCVLLISNMNEELTQPDHLFILFGVYGDVQVEIRNF